VATNFSDVSEAEQIELMTELAVAFLSDYDLDVSTVTMVNHGYNSTLAVTTRDGQRSALRVNVNSPRTPENLNAELAWMQSLGTDTNVSLPRPVRNASGDWVTWRHSEALGRSTSAVLFSWLEGCEVYELDDPTTALRETGRLLATLHDHGRHFALPAGSSLPRFTDVLWGFDDHLTGLASTLDPADRALIAAAMDVVRAVLDRLARDAPPQIIHADVHGGNLMWHEGQLSVFDFDDSGLGLPIQDLAVALYYFREPGQRALILEGYRDVAPLPPHAEGDLDVLILQRRLQLLNYVLESRNPEHREWLGRSLATTREEITTLLARRAD
jgi:Ser/Thr protein kinase RdoA (MazF antagonist)